MISIKQQDIINFLQQISAVAVASHIAVTNPSEDLIKSSEVVERYCNGNKKGLKRMIENGLKGHINGNGTNATVRYSKAEIETLLTTTNYFSPFLRQLRDEVEANKGVALIEYKEF